ncbi:hypothetical protein AQI88_31955 [Streptomyces cellostaticus]|uniref:Uncharacterized protein n=1 Tax=Streptomyces cellostaticus TaxID=67285 RepID=A0A117PUL9_9ACTN|nr:hypothetical protein [Streptomyces cellostaticus]KUM92526.1 hypothetical protein AQI88_31955 [Streptomyces cellostaticus]GHI09385.1 hypothetical protein Scel_77060 [Streptomyces cellostaticus]
MDIANHLAVIDRLCAREFPAEHGRTDVGTGGPGYLIAELQTSGDFYEDDGTEREETQAQYEADRDALGERLAERWGPADRISLYSAFRQSMEGEEPAEPWGTLASHVPDVQLWRTESGRWAALGVSQWDGELPFQLLAVITETDPP